MSSGGIIFGMRRRFESAGCVIVQHGYSNCPLNSYQQEKRAEGKLGDSEFNWQ
jgi:hypothetical protein